MFEPYNVRLSKRKKFRGLRNVILDIIARSKIPPTTMQILTRVKQYLLPFDSTLSSINNLLQKLARKNIIEFVYMDLAYGTAFTEKGREEYQLLF